MSRLSQKLCRFLANSAVTLLAAALAFTIAELAFRRLPAGERFGWNVPIPLDDRLQRYNTKAPLRMLALGDSFTEYLDVQGKNYIRFAAALANAAGFPLEALNLGQSGTGMIDYLYNFKSYEPVVRPQIVVFGVYVGNDLRNVDKRVIPPPQEGLYGALKHSRLLNAAWQMGKYYFPTLQSDLVDKGLVSLGTERRADPELVRARLAAVDPDLVARARADLIAGADLVFAAVWPTYYRDLAQASSNSMRNSIKQLFGLWDETALHCRETRAKCLIVLIPVAPWVGKKQQKYFTQLGYDVLGLEDEKPPVIEVLKEKLEALGMPYLDILPVLRRSADRELFIQDDIHLSVEGQELVGRALFDDLVRRKWISPKP